MPTYELRFRIPEAKGGDPLATAAFRDTISWCNTRQEAGEIKNTQLMSGSLVAHVQIEGNSYEEVLERVMERTRLVMLDWTMGELLDPLRMEGVLDKALERAGLE